MYPAATDLVAITSNKTDGRYAIADRDVKVGDTLIQEKPFCFSLLYDFCLTHCQNCFARTIVPISCPRCANVIFCSVKCRTVALDSYHKYECSILPNLWASGASVTCHLSLRALSQKDLQYYLDLKPSLTKEITGPYKSKDYRTIYNLVRHETLRNFEDFFHRTNMAVFLMRCLKFGGYFEGLEGKDNEVFVGSLILRNLQAMQFNCHEIAEMQRQSAKDSGQSVFLGGGLFPTLALLNHSCDPGIVRYFKGTSVVVKAVKNIPKGSHISENYGPIFTQIPAENRKSMLKQQYWFDCKCIPCEDGWPLLKNMEDDVMRFRCNSEEKCPAVILVKSNINEFMVKCDECGQYTNILKGLKSLQDTDAMFKLALRLQETFDYKNALDKYLEVFHLLDATLVPPFKDFHLCQQGIRRCMLALGSSSIIT